MSSIMYILGEKGTFPARDRDLELHRGILPDKADVRSRRLTSHCTKSARVFVEAIEADDLVQLSSPFLLSFSPGAGWNAALQA